MFAIRWHFPTFDALSIARYTTRDAALAEAIVLIGLGKAPSNHFAVVEV